MAKGKPFTPEFRAEAVRLHRMGGRTLRATAAEIGVSVNALGRWVRQSKIDEGKASGLTSEEREEFQRLKRENKLLREEKEILKKAYTFLRPGDRSRKTRFKLIDEEKSHHAVSRLARTLGVTRAGYYAWRKRALK